MYGMTIYSDAELKEIQRLELEALRELIRICGELGIDYFLIDGAAIGAVRHRGFIPWDDDIDIGMTRDNYRRFLKEAPPHLSPQYFLQTPYQGRDSPYFYAKLRINGTRFVEYCNRKLDVHHGVYIDICPFDEVPDDERLNKRQFRRCQLLIRLFVLRQSPDLSAAPTTIKRKILSVLRKCLHMLLRIVPYCALASALERETTRYNGTGQSALAFLHYPVRKTDYMLKTELGGFSKAEFEGILVNVPQDCDAYLRRHYGDYMQWPPPEKRYGHKPYELKLGAEMTAGGDGM